MCLHKKEKLVSEIICKLAIIMRDKYNLTPSTMVWDPRCTYSKTRLDPNYLWDEFAHESPFNKGLNHFVGNFYHGKDPRECPPLMHIDFHGKLNRKDNLNMDVGSIA